MPLRLPRPVARAIVRTSLRPILSEKVPVPAQRIGVHAATAGLLPLLSVRVTRENLGGVNGRAFGPRSVTGDRALLYLHGGGYVAGSSFSHRGLVARLADGLSAKAFAPDYRLAPEFPFPSAVDDALASYQSLRRSGYAAEQIVLAGDSAGGGLALATALRLRAAGEELPAALGLISPWVDLELTGDSVTRNADSDPLLQESWLRSCVAAYRGEQPAGTPEISPLRADLTGLPPVVLHTGTDEIIASDSARLAERAREAGVDVSYREFEPLWHDFHLFGGFLHDADVAIADLSQQIIARLGKG